MLQGHLEDIETFYSVKRDIFLPPLAPPEGPPRQPGAAFWRRNRALPEGKAPLRRPRLRRGNRLTRLVTQPVNRLTGQAFGSQLHPR